MEHFHFLRKKLCDCVVVALAAELGTQMENCSVPFSSTFPIGIRHESNPTAREKFSSRRRVPLCFFGNFFLLSSLDGRLSLVSDAVFVLGFESSQHNFH